jgi:hypothetical protein
MMMVNKLEAWPYVIDLRNGNWGMSLSFYLVREETPPRSKALSTIAGGKSAWFCKVVLCL